MKSYNILTFNNQVGIVTDAILLMELIKENISEKVSIEFINENKNKNNDVGIWIQNFDLNKLNNYRKNIFYINEEWAGTYEISNFHLFDYVICKSKYTYDLLKNNKNVIYLPFISKDCYDKNIIKNNKFLHFVGRSIQKNAELVLRQNIDITIIDPFNRYKPSLNFNHINTYQTDKQIIHLLNTHNIHMCCSLYESWGHYLFEGLSTGAEIICSDIPVFKEQLDPELVHFIPTIEKIDLNYYYCSDNVNKNFPLRKSFFVNELEFEYKIKNFKPIGKNEDRRKLFKHIIDTNYKQLINFFKDI